MAPIIAAIGRSYRKVSPRDTAKGPGGHPPAFTSTTTFPVAWPASLYASASRI